MIGQHTLYCHRFSYIKQKVVHAVAKIGGSSINTIPCMRLFNILDTVNRVPARFLVKIGEFRQLKKIEESPWLCCQMYASRFWINK